MRREAPSELVDPPAAGRVFDSSSRAGFADCAPSGRVRLDGLARWLQDVAYADVEDAGLAEVAVWVVRRTRINVARFPRFSERHELSTFCSGVGRMWAERRTTIRQAGQTQAGVEAVSLWVHLDPETWRPVPFSQREFDLYGMAAVDRRVSARLHHPGPPADGTGRPWSFRATELDIAGHVNNAAYWQPLEEELLGQSEPAAIDVEIEYRAPCQPGQKLVVGDGGPVGVGTRRWILGSEGQSSASLLVRGLSGADA